MTVLLVRLSRGGQVARELLHDSEKCKADFKEAALWFLQPANNQLTQGFSPGALLLSNAQRNFGTQINQAGVTHFEAYMQVLETLARSIVP